MSRIKRHISPFDLAKLFFNSGPSFLVTLIFAVVLIAAAGPINTILQEQRINFTLPETYVPGIFLLIIATIQLTRKVLRLKTNIRVLRYGAIAYCELTGINQTGIVENDGALLEYEFTFQVNDQKLCHYLKSSRLYNMSTGSTYVIFYLPQNPEQAYIPELNGLKSISADIEGLKNY